jgi:hypothetical protein
VIAVGRREFATQRESRYFENMPALADVPDGDPLQVGMVGKFLEAEQFPAGGRNPSATAI